MGQGHYVEYGYGCILEKDHPLAKDYKSGEIYELTDKARKKWSYDKKPFLRVPYESEVFYLAFSLADCGQFQLNDSYPSIVYTAFRISEIKKFLESKGIDFLSLDKE